MKCFCSDFHAYKVVHSSRTDRNDANSTSSRCVVLHSTDLCACAMHQYYTEKESFLPPPPLLPPAGRGYDDVPPFVHWQLPPNYRLIYTPFPPRPENAYDEIVACNAVCMPKKYGIANKIKWNRAVGSPHLLGLMMNQEEVQGLSFISSQFPPPSASEPSPGRQYQASPP